MALLWVQHRLSFPAKGPWCRDGSAWGNAQSLVRYHGIQIVYELWAMAQRLVVGSGLLQSVWLTELAKPSWWGVLMHDMKPFQSAWCFVGLERILKHIVHLLRTRRVLNIFLFNCDNSPELRKKDQ
jgi:hypothetical protein